MVPFTDQLHLRSKCLNFMDSNAVSLYLMPYSQTHACLHSIRSLLLQLIVLRRSFFFFIAFNFFIFETVVTHTRTNRIKCVTLYDFYSRQLQQQYQQQQQH